MFVGTCIVCILYQRIMKLLPSFHHILTDFEHVSFIAWVTFILCSLNLEYIKKNLSASAIMVDKGGPTLSFGSRGIEKKSDSYNTMC